LDIWANISKNVLSRGISGVIGNRGLQIGMQWNVALSHASGRGVKPTRWLIQLNFEQLQELLTAENEENGGRVREGTRVKKQFLSVLCGCSLRPLRSKAFTAETAEKGRRKRREIRDLWSRGWNDG